ncbi:MAG: hypothetical protein GVY34_01665 [Alphaproteobacteria bacterium]|nr:hypothetical protein [Alphaproteobacteria bacterium]
MLTAVAALSPIIGFISSITTPAIKSRFLIGNEQRFYVCNVQEYCEQDNQRFEKFLSKSFNEYVRLDITYDTLTEDWDECFTEKQRPEQFSVSEASDFVDIPLFGHGDCVRGRIARFDSDVLIENGSLGTGNRIFRIIGDFVVGGTSQMYFLTRISRNL